MCANMRASPGKDELKPPLQQRSAAAHRRMVRAGLRLLELRDIDQISIRDIVSEADTSVGSFYHRFGTKEQFFNHLIDDMIVRREEAAMREIADRRVPITSTAEVLARGAMKNFRRHAGLLRSAVKWHIAGDRCWERINMMARRIVDEYQRRLSESLGRPIDTLERERINFAFVWLYGLLVHRTLRLNVIQGHTVSDKVFEEETIRNFRQLIERAVSHWGAVRTKA